MGGPLFARPTGNRPVRSRPTLVVTRMSGVAASMPELDGLLPTTSGAVLTGSSRINMVHRYRFAHGAGAAFMFAFAQARFRPSEINRWTASDLDQICSRAAQLSSRDRNHLFG
jgi:hypothetical protein